MKISNWVIYDIEIKVRTILTNIKNVRKHHFGRPYLTAYQLAIVFSQSYPNEFKSLGYQIGGKNSGKKSSLSQYLARELSGRIKSQEIIDIEGCFISNLHLDSIILDHNGNKIESSLTHTKDDLSMFRLK